MFFSKKTVGRERWEKKGRGDIKQTFLSYLYPKVRYKRSWGRFLTRCLKFEFLQNFRWPRVGGNEVSGWSKLFPRVRWVRVEGREGMG